jgi:3-oxoacyl-[acyl-carrier-protein] synthase III
MLLTVGDGAACILLERAPGPGFLAMLHGSEPALADAIAVRTPFPPAGPDARYLYDFQESCRIGVFIHEQWRSLFRDSLEAAQIRREELSHWFFHQTHGGQVEELWRDCGAPPHAKAGIVQTHGNMGTPTFAVAMARDFAGIAPGQKFLLQAVGGGVSWCAIVAEHR